MADVTAAGIYDTIEQIELRIASVLHISLIAFNCACHDSALVVFAAGRGRDVDASWNESVDLEMSMQSPLHLVSAASLCSRERRHRNARQSFHDTAVHQCEPLPVLQTLVGG